MKIYYTLFLLFVVNLSFGQTSIGILAEPQFQITQISDDNSSAFDSLQSMKEIDRVLGLQLEFRNQIDRYQAISFIPGFQQANYHHVIDDIQFLDIIHDQMPEIRDLSQASTKTAYMHYRFKYISARVMYYNKLKGMYINNGFNFELGAGLSYAYLFDHDLKIRTEGFAIKDQFVHYITDSTGFEGRTHQANLVFNFNMNYEFVPTAYLVAGVMLNVPVLTTTTNDPRLKIYGSGLQFGIRKEL